MVSSDVVFVLAYVLFVVCVVHPPVEIHAAGFTIPQLFGAWLGNENIEFVQFHIKRTALTLFIYSLLPLAFFAGCTFFVADISSGLLFFLTTHPALYSLLFTLALGLPVLAIVQIYAYYKNAWAHHPLAETLRRFANANSTWETIASDINSEYRSIDKVILRTSPITTLIVTENWIVKVLPLGVFVAHQSDATLTVRTADMQAYSYENPSRTAVSQYLTIAVTSERVPAFLLRLNALDFQDVQDRVGRRIQVPADVNFHRTVHERFADAFKEAIKDNARYDLVGDADLCIGCMNNRSNIKLQKYCEDVGGGGGGDQQRCTQCYCRPMWCVDCLANWFAHRQDAAAPDTWLAAKCTCPTCRATFCLLDVCPITITPNE